MSSPMFSGNSSPGSNSGSFSLEGTQEFLNSNSLVAKFAFLLLILIVFVLALRAGIQFLTWLFTPSGSPHLLDGMIDAQHMKVITQDPATSGSIPIIRSNNQLDGIEFTWSIWIYIDNIDIFSTKEMMILIIQKLLQV